MPVRKMTQAERKLIFGSGFVIIGMKRPTKSAIQKTGDTRYGNCSATSEVEVRRDDIRGQWVADPYQATKKEVE